MANHTTTTDAVMIAEVWTKEIEKPFYNALYAKDLVKRRDSLVADGGDTIHVPFLSTYNARTKAAGTQVTFDANTETEITISINKHKYLAMLIEDIVKVQANYNLQSEFRGAMAEAVARSVDSDLLGLHASAGTNVSGGATIDDADILSVVSALDAANVPQDERAGIVGYKTMNDLRGVNKYVAYDQTGKTGLAASNKAIISSVYNMDLYMSNNVVDDTTNTHNLFFHKSGLSLAVQKKPTYEMEYSVSDVGWKVLLHTIYGVAVERANAVVDLERNS